MRVLIFSTDDHLYPAGGAENAMAEIATRMRDVAFDLVCARIRPGALPVEQDRNIRIHRIGFGIPRIDGYLLALFGHRLALRLHREQRYDLIWSIMASYGSFAAVKVKKATGLPFLLTLQEGDAVDDILKKVSFVRSAFKEIFQTADALQAISNYLLAWGREMGFQGTNGRVIPNGVSIASFTASFSSEELSATRRSFGFSDRAFILITSSRLEKKNGIMDVIEALPSLPGVCFVVCGSGSLDKKLRARVKKLHLESRVTFLGFVKITELPKLFKSSDAFIRPSLSEGLGNAFLEAFASRIPVIGTPVGGIPDFLVEGETGFLCAPEHPQSIVEAVTRLRTLDTKTRERIRSTAYERVVASYDWNTIAKSMRNLFADLTHARHRP